MPISKVANKKHQKTKNVLHNNIPKSESKYVKSYKVNIVGRSIVKK